MSYLEDVRESNKNLNKMYGMVTKDDLSDTEREIVNSVNAELKDGMNALHLFNETNALIAKVEQQLENPYNYFTQLVISEDEVAKRFQADAAHDAKLLEDYSKEVSGKLDAEKKALKEKNAAEKAYLSYKKDYEEKTVSYTKKYEEEKRKAEASEDARLSKLVKELQEKEMQQSELRKELEDINGTISGINKQLLVFDLAMKEMSKKAPEYKEYTKQVVALNATLEKNRKLGDSKREKYNFLVAKISDLNEKINDKSAYNKQKEAIENMKKELDNRLSKMDVNGKYADFKNASDKYTKASSETAEINAKIKELQGNVDKSTGKCATYAYNLLMKQKEELIDKLGKITDYNKIQSALNNKEPEKSGRNLIKGLEEVTKVYREYKQMHSGFARMFRNTGMFSVGRDYTAFNTIREKFIRYSGVTRADIDNYLDNGVLSGTLAGIKKEDIHPETMVEKDYTKKEGVSPEKYANRMKEIYTDELFPQNKKFGSGTAILKIDEGLKMLNALGDLKRKENLLCYDDAISTISNDLRGKGMTNGLANTIDAEIENALKKPVLRSVIERDIDPFIKSDYEDVKAASRELEKNNEHAVLDRKETIHGLEKLKGEEVEAPAIKRQVNVEYDLGEVNEDMLDKVMKTEPVAENVKENN